MQPLLAPVASISGGRAAVSSGITSICALRYDHKPVLLRPIDAEFAHRSALVAALFWHFHMGKVLL